MKQNDKQKQPGHKNLIITLAYAENNYLQLINSK